MFTKNQAVTGIIYDINNNGADLQVTGTYVRPIPAFGMVAGQCVAHDILVDGKEICARNIRAA